MYLILLEAGPESAEPHLHCSMESLGKAGNDLDLDLDLVPGRCSFLLKQFIEHGSGSATLSALSELADLNLTQVCFICSTVFLVIAQISLKTAQEL